MPVQRRPRKIESQKLAIAFVAIEEFCRRHVRHNKQHKRTFAIRFSVCVQGYEASGHYVVDNVPINFKRKPPPKSKRKLREEAHRREIEAHNRHVARLYKERERRQLREENNDKSSRRHHRLFEQLVGSISL